MHGVKGTNSGNHREYRREFRLSAALGGLLPLSKRHGGQRVRWVFRSHIGYGSENDRDPRHHTVVWPTRDP